MTTLFFSDETATAEIYTLSLHDALPISGAAPPPEDRRVTERARRHRHRRRDGTRPRGRTRVCAGGLRRGVQLRRDAGAGSRQIGRAHVRTPVTSLSRMPSSA